MSVLAFASACTPIEVATSATTPDGLRKHQPFLVADTPRTMVEISGCMQDYVDRIGLPISYVPRPAGATIEIFLIAPLLVVDIEDRGQTRHVTFYAAGSDSETANAKTRERFKFCI